ncbi:hypothetical protein FOQG_14845 [Fusarium oxysporum f. sp. raphani 54005]|uniref:Beta-galactosidase n=2 Tax=Fusarium oxysporum f. sp. raphani TaxID=96318 RepID=X0BQ85_FUSOX|nr:hypothetical protein FOQG_14845 [Fusarium oxysporum f. sp. raphani 54005]KAG7438429.1 Beta-galactosidase BoGH2A [Fusarium oxysporum f. sp. raphani]
MTRTRTNFDKGWQLHVGNNLDSARKLMAKAGTTNGWSDLTNEELEAAGLKQTIAESMGPYFQVIKARPSSQDADWRAVNLPHDWRFEQKPSPDHPEAADYPRTWQGFFPTGVAYYRKLFELQRSELGERCSITFGGIAGYSDIWLNGFWLGQQSTSYSPVTFDVTELLRFGSDGPNVMLVQTDTREPEGWWYEGGGIYRHVWLDTHSNVHAVVDGLYIRTPVATAEKAVVKAEVQVVNDTSHSQNVGAYFIVEDDEGREIVRTDPNSMASISIRNSTTISGEMELPNPKLWTLGSGGLYRMTAVVTSSQGSVLDQVSSTFGVRTIEWVDDGIKVNGKWTKIYGANIHQDWAVYGIGLPDRLIEHKIDLCIEMGVNAIRSAHHAPTPELVDYADRRGVLLLLESRAFSTTPASIQQLQSLVRRFRNRPSVLMWSIENEEMDFQGTNVGRAILSRLVGEIKALDPDRPTTFGGVLAFEDASYYSLTDIVGMHYRAFFGVLDETIQYVPDRPHVLDEEGLYASTRGVYHYNKENAHAGSLSHLGEVMMDAPNPAANAALMPPNFNITGNIASTLTKCFTCPKVSGCFVWTALDYLGEPTPLRWPATTSSYGARDLCGLPKDYYWLLRSLMRSEEPLVHAFPHWTWPGREGERLPYRAYTNCDSVEFFVNGVSVAHVAVSESLVIVDDGLEYQPGQLVARGFRNGQAVAEHAQVTAGQPACLSLTTDRYTLSASEDDVALIRVAVTDKDGNLIPDAENAIELHVQGQGRLVGVHNGDPSTDNYKCYSKTKAFNGYMVAYVGSSNTLGEIAVTASAEGLSTGTITLSVSDNELQHLVHAVLDEAENKEFGLHTRLLR